VSPFDRAQDAVSDLKVAISEELKAGPKAGLTSSQIGRNLGIQFGYAGGNEGHVARALLDCWKRTRSLYVSLGQSAGNFWIQRGS
jgi:hypothetical protein